MCWRRYDSLDFQISNARIIYGATSVMGTSFVFVNPFAGSKSWICSVAAPGTSTPVPTPVLVAKKRPLNVQLPAGSVPSPAPQSTSAGPEFASRFAGPWMILTFTVAFRVA